MVEGDLGTRPRFVLFPCSVLLVLISRRPSLGPGGWATPHQLVGTHPASQSPSLTISGSKVNIMFSSILSDIL